MSPIQHSVTAAPRLRRSAPCAALGVLLLTLLWSLASAAGAPEARAVAGKGIIDVRLEAAGTPSARAAIVRDLDGGLGARWVRLVANWPDLEPQRGVYDQAALAHLDALVHDLRAAGVRIVLTTCYLPEWASDERFWDDPPPGMAKGYRPFYPIDDDALDDFALFGETLAGRYGSHIHALECWNEPNLWGYIYPQRVASDEYFGARVYLRMLKAFSRGVRRAGTAVRVLAGATAPVGLNDRLRTSPQRFARFLKRSGAGRYFDGYSHHPYTPGGSMNHAPDQTSNDPTTTVTLYNLRTLLRLFPGKPFYLTEYGYNTRPSAAFGGFVVTERAQALYLKTAYAMARRHPQVKALFWFLIRDARPASGPLDAGTYTGLRRADGSKKPAWYAYRDLR